MLCVSRYGRVEGDKDLVYFYLFIYFPHCIYDEVYNLCRSRRHPHIASHEIMRLIGGLRLLFFCFFYEGRVKVDISNSVCCLSAHNAQNANAVPNFEFQMALNGLV